MNLKPNQTAVRMPNIKSEVYEILNEDGTRDRIINAQVEAALIANPSMLYLRHYSRTLYAIQRFRIGAGNREGALKRMGLDEVERTWMQENIDEDLHLLEYRLESRCAKYLKTMPVWTEYLSKISGIGPRLGSSFVAIIVTPARFETVSSLWKYFGVAVDEKGNIQKRQSGEQAMWSAEGRMALYKLQDSFIKTGKGYRELYDRFKAEAISKNEILPEAERLTPGHLKQQVRRKVGKLFLSHLWETWRGLEGLPTRKAYILEHGHTGYIPPFTDH